MIKKFAAFFTFILVFSLFFTGCSESKNSEIEGEWVPSTAVINGTTVNYSTLGLDDNNFLLCFEAGDKCTAVLTGITYNCTYTFNGTSIDLIINNEEHKLGYEAGIISYNLDTDNTTMQINFTRKR